MAIHVALNHLTQYRYDRPVLLAPQVLRLRPAPHCRTPILSYSLKVEPADHFENWQQDPQGNYLARLVFPERTRSLRIEVDLVAELSVINPFDFFIEASADHYPFAYEPWLSEELAPYLVRVNAGPKLESLVAGVSRAERRTVDFLVELNAQLQRAIRYVVRLEPGIQTCEETLERASGSCRDTAWLLVQIMRHLGVAARFVSGYLIQLAPDVKSLDGPSGTEVDFTDLHAWCEVYLPGAGWIGLDPTSGLLVGEGHIPLACTPDPASAAPITGGMEICETEFDFSMRVTRIHEDPRVTKPYTDEAWQAIESLGHAVDERLIAGDVRLTMGGEPTFVSIDDMESPEWSTAAVGPTKRARAEDLVFRLREKFGQGGFLHFGQGKWYPGEQLPRWALGCYWRTDGQPIWTRPELVADASRSYGCGPREAKQFVQTLASQLEVESRWVAPVFEDIWHYLATERKLPANLDPRDAKLKDAEERARLAQIFERGLDSEVGFVLPLRRQWWQTQPRWISGPWPVRSGKLFLLPGDSPIGLRLPLDSLPWSPASPYPIGGEIDPLARRSGLSDFSELRRRAAEHAGISIAAQRGLARDGQADAPAESDPIHEQVAPDSPHETGAPIVRTALCVEPRDGRLHVFMPPVERLEDYLDLLVRIEETAAALETPVIVEGYLPPHDDRLNHIKVTPDPGVIEVNVQPAHSWDELVRITTTVYDEARLARLGTEKFDLDGRHTGTGGGNHIVLGGATPADSPFLRRPDLLRSLIGYWNNHPSLSYLFSGSFIGPTSQAPRVDEGRRDAIYEMQIAFDQIPEQGDCPPWIVDRIFRHLLVDLTGNTHRAEFCIDKLFSPDSSTGRLGLVEFRAFEMPPHARMSLTQQLLLRSLVARFWESPYRAKLVRWGTLLHDRFMLPHFLREDFADIIAETRAAGIPVELDWFTPHFEFRFPKIGEFAQRGIVVELRQAAEPWYVLGEEPAGGGTARYVDSSVERLQVHVRGMVDSRHTLACNGRQVPLQPTGTQGVFAAGVRYRAWQPPSCLHPTIAVHTPLVFDLVDTWQGRSIGGCTYHVSHPGGLSYTTFPVNAYEAESRRGTRFVRMGHTPGPWQPTPATINPDFPLTLDLRLGEQRS